MDVDAPIARVWTALIEADGLAAWWSTRVDTEKAAVGSTIQFTFAGDFNPVMEIVNLSDGREVSWRCIAGHDHLTVAELLGHADGTMLAKVYAHLDQADEHLRKALEG